MTNLWEAVEYNEQLEQKFDDVVEHLKLSKQKGYKMNFDLSEKLKTINTTIQELLKEQTTMTTQQDQDVIQVNGFLKTLDSIVSEMELIEDSDIKILILDVKLKKVAELYKTFLPFRDDLDSYRNYYAYVKAQKEKSNKKEQSTYNWVTRKELYKLNLTTHNLIKILTADENGIPQFYWTPSDKFPEKPNTYSPNWYYKEGSTYFIYTKPVNIQEIKIDQYVTGFVNPDGKVIYYDQYL